jgi:predicted RNA-binding protein with EMAP domain
MTGTEYKPTTTHELYHAVEKFISDHRGSRDLDERWLADVLKSILPLISEVRNSRLSPDNRAAVHSFRALEIEEALQTKRREMEILERDLKKIKAA